MGFSRILRRAAALGILTCIMGATQGANLPPAAASGAAWLQSQLQANGSFANPNGIATDFQAESEALRTLEDTGTLTGPQGGATQGLLAAETYDDSENLSRKILAATETGQGTSALITSLLANQNLDGSFGELPGYQGTFFDTAYALIALNVAGQGNTDAAHNAALLLVNKQSADGSWSDWQGTDTAYSTGLVVQALAPYRLQLASMALAIKSGLTYLSSVRQSGSDWGSPFIDAQVIIALSAGNGDPVLLSGVAADLTNAQSADGSWGDDTFTTALAVRALAAAQATAPPTQAQGSAQGYVVEAGSGRPIAGATVFLPSNPQITTTSNSAGYFVLSNLPLGSVTLAGRAPGYDAVSIVVSVTGGATTQASQLVLGQDAATGMLFGKISSQQNGTALAAATVALSGPASYSATTAGDGGFSLPSIAPGQYTFTVSASGYITVTGSVSVTAGGQYQLDQALLLTGTYQDSSPVTVSANVLDAVSGAVIPGATLTLAPGFSTTSSSDGSASIAAVPMGSYQATVSASGYVTATYAISLTPGSNGQLGSLRLYPVSAAAASATLSLVTTVVDGLTNRPISGATVTDTDTGASVTTDASGVATLSALTTLTVNLQVSASGYSTLAFTVTASGFGAVAETLVLPASGGSSGATSVQLSGTVTDASTGTAIPNATVALSDATAQFVTGSTGSYQLPNITSLNFSLQVSATGYITQTVPVTLSQFGNYTLAIQLTPAQPASTLQILTVDAKSAILAATDTGVFTATIGNTGTSDVQAALIAEVTDAQGAVIAEVGGQIPNSSTKPASFDVPAGGQVQADFDWAPQQLPPGGYTVTVYAEQPGTATRTAPHGVVLAQGNTQVAVNPTEAMTGQLAFSPPLSQAGSQTPVAISALVINSGNETIATLPLHLTITDPASGNVIYSADATTTQLPVNNNVTVSFGSWLPTTTGNLKVHVAPADGTVAGAIDGTLYVGNKATAQLTIDKTIVPPGANTVHAKVAIQGVDISQAISVDPMFFAAQRAVTNGGAYVGPNAEQWTKTNQCISCHIQSQSLVGLASATGKATIDQSAIQFLATELATTQHNDGSMENSFPGLYNEAITILNLWGLNTFQDNGTLFANKLAAANFLHQQRTVSGSKANWHPQDPRGWWPGTDQLTALAIKDFVGVLQASSSANLSNVVSYAWSPLTAQGTLDDGNDLKPGPDGRLYAVQRNGVIVWYDPTLKTTGKITVSGMPGTVQGLAIASDGSFYLSGVGFVAHVVTGQANTFIYRGGDDVTEVALSPAGVLYGIDFTASKLVSWNGTVETTVLGNHTLNSPLGLAFDTTGNLMITDSNNFDLIEIAADGTVSTRAQGLAWHPYWVTSDGQGGWYVLAGPTTINASTELFHFPPTGVGSFVADTTSYDGITMFDGALVTTNSVPNGQVVQLVSQPVNATAELANLQQDVSAGAQYLLARYRDSNPDLNIQALRLWGLAEARKVVTDPTLQSQLDQAVAYLDALLRTEQHTDGGWGLTNTAASDAIITALVGLALDYSHPSPQDTATRKAIQFLLNNQAGDGSWFSADGLMTTRLSSTSLVMDYLPEALQFLGGIDVDLYVQDVPGKASLSGFVPAPGDTVIGGDGSSTYNWHLTGVTSEEDVTFNVNLPGMLANETRPVAGSAYLQFKNSFTGELLTTQLDIPTVQAVSGLGVTVGTDRPQYPAATPVVISGNAGNTGVPTVNAQVQLSITAADGTVVATLPAITGLAIPTSGELPYTAQWNTGEYLPGTYTVTASILDDSGTVANKAVTSFIIANSSAGGTGSTEAALRTSTDRIVYNTTDAVNIADLVQSITDNSILSLVHLHVTVTDPSGNTVGTYDHDLGQLAPGAIDNLPDVLALNHAVQGHYSVTGTLTDSSGAVLATGSAMFSVAENLARTLIGQVSVQSPSVYEGNPEVCTDTAINNGTLTLSNQPLQELVVNLDTGATVSTVAASANLAPTQQQQSTETVDTTPLGVGHYACVLQAELNGSWSSLGYTAFQVTDPTAALTGTLTATPNQVPLTTNLTLAGTVTDGGTASVPGVTATISIQDASGNTVFSSPTSLGTLAASQTSQLLASWTATGTVGATYTAVLTATVGPKSKVLAQAPFTLLPPPIKIGAGMTEGTHGRVLILTDDPAAYQGDQDPFGPNPAPGLAAQNQHLGQVLTAAGWSYTIVTNADDFQTQFNTGGYEVYVILSEAVKLPEGVQEAVDQAVQNGQGLIMAGNHDDRNNKLEDALGIHSTGKSLSVTGLELDSNSLDQAGGQVGFPIDGQPLTVNKDSAATVGNFALTGGGTAPAVYTYAHGSGKSVYVAFDLALEEAAAANGANSLFDQLMLDSLSYVSPTSLTPYTGRVIPLVLTIQNLGVATPGEAIVSLPSGVTVIDPNGAVVSGNSLTWVFDLAVGETLTETFWVKLPATAGSVSVAAVIDSGTPPALVNQASTSMLISVQARP